MALLSTGNVENIPSLTHAEFPNIGISHNIKKSCSINFTELIKKVFDKYRFSKILIFAWKLEFYHWQWWQTHFVQFQENVHEIFKYE